MGKEIFVYLEDLHPESRSEWVGLINLILMRSPTGGRSFNSSAAHHEIEEGGSLWFVAFFCYGTHPIFQIIFWPFGQLGSESL